MIRDWSELKIFVRPGRTDMRKQIDGLATLVRDQLGHNPLDGSLYLFCGINGRRLKVLYWDRNGFCLWQKRLEQDRFPWPEGEEEVRQIDRGQLAMLLDGIDFWHAHQRREYQFV
ncbi:MAG: IS66 family insertion sequence element accessory protein TnpB [Candidatus Micrarchaeaceae archaeon]